MSIKKLNKKTIDLINAGEVIECPADVLKELIENSIDAHAKTIKVNVKSAGVELIEIVDDGVGINKDDLNICLEKYTTSKINDIDDLYSLNSFGFRGEALSSISSVSHVEILSSTDDSGKGCLLDLNKNLVSKSFKKGTQITIRDLFYNLPVRKKFLKSKSFEFSKIYDVFLEFVVANPQIKFLFSSEKKNEIFYNTSRENRFLQVFGKEFKNKTIDVDLDSDFYSVKGVVLKPRSNFNYPRNFVYINGRCVHFPQLNALLKTLYKDYLMIQEKPFFILFFNIVPNTIDVNVHPKKRLVKLQNESIFLIDFKEKMSSVLFSDKEVTKSFKTPDASFFKKPSSFNSFSDKQTPSTPKMRFSEKLNVRQNYFVAKEDVEAPLVFNNKEIVRIVGQIHETYILCETKKEALIIDQHAAAERINLEKNEQSEDKLTEKQRLVFEKKIPFLNDHQMLFLKENKTLFFDLGFDYIFKDNVVCLTTIPFFIKTYFDTNVFLNLVNDLQDNITENYKTIKSNILKKYSCSESIKANQSLSFFEIKKLIKELDACEHKMICAHGRPTVIILSLNDFEKMFKRIV